MRCRRLFCYRILLLAPLLLLSAADVWARAGGGGGGGGSDGGDGDSLLDLVFDLIGLALEYPPLAIVYIIIALIIWLVKRRRNNKPDQTNPDT